MKYQFQRGYHDLESEYENIFFLKHLVKDIRLFTVPYRTIH